MTEKEIEIRWKAEDMAKALVLDSLLEFEKFQQEAPDLCLTLKEMVAEQCLKIFPPAKVLQ